MEFDCMKKFSSQLCAWALLVATSTGAFAQQPAPTPQAVDENEVVRITTNLVQVDAVVTDKAGRQVTDLRPEDFEVLEDGRPQPITNLAYVALDRRTIQTTNANPTGAKAATINNAPAAPM